MGARGGASARCHPEHSEGSAERVPDPFLSRHPTSLPRPRFRQRMRSPGLDRPAGPKPLCVVCTICRPERSEGPRRVVLLRNRPEIQGLKTSSVLACEVLLSLRGIRTTTRPFAARLYQLWSPATSCRRIPQKPHVFPLFRKRNVVLVDRSGGAALDSSTTHTAVRRRRTGARGLVSSTPASNESQNDTRRDRESWRRTSHLKK